MNPLLEKPNNPTGQQTDLKQLYSMFTSQDPTKVFNMLAQKHPQLLPAIQMMKNGMNPEQLVRSICAQRGIKVEDLLNQFR